MSEPEPLLRVRGAAQVLSRFGGGMLLQGMSGWVRAVDGVDLDVAEGEYGRAGGRVGLRQVDSRASRSCACVEADAPAKSLFRRPGSCCGFRAAPRCVRCGASHADHLPGSPTRRSNPRMTHRRRRCRGHAGLRDPPDRERGTERDQARRRAAASCVAAPSPTTMRRYPHEFSGGQRQRVGIARALARRAAPADRGRRAGVLARRVDPGADPEPAARRCRSALGIAYPVHLARPAASCATWPTAWPSCTWARSSSRRPPSGSTRSPQPPLHRGAALWLRCPSADPATTGQRSASCSRATYPSRRISPPAGCPLPPALPRGVRTLSAPGAALLPR